MRGVQAFQQCRHDSASDGHRDRLLCFVRGTHQGEQGFAVDVLHHDDQLVVVRQHVHDGNDVGVKNARCQSGLDQEHAPKVGVLKKNAGACAWPPPRGKNPPEPTSRARCTVAMPPAAISSKIAYRPTCCSGCFSIAARVMEKYEQPSPFRGRAKPRLTAYVDSPTGILKAHADMRANRQAMAADLSNRCA